MTILLWLVLFIHIINGESNPKPLPTLVDILSSQPQFSYFLRHIQRQGLIPQLNLMHNMTLLAPINSAFVDKSSYEWDNNQLLRYVVNQKFRVGYLGEQDAIFETLYKIDKSYYPIRISPDFETHEYVIDEIATIIEEDIYAKHQHSFVQAIDHLLPLKPTVCQILMNSTIAEISIISEIFQSLFDEKECHKYMKGYNTFMLPSNDVMKSSLSKIQLNYYKLASNEEIKKDTLDLLDNLMFPDLILGVNNTNHKRKAKSGMKHQIDTKKNRLLLDTIETDNSHLLADGVVHIFNNKSFFSKLEIPTVEMIAWKSLYALNYTNFVKEIKFRSLEYLIDGSSANQSIILDIDQRDDTEDIGVTSFSSKQNLLYQFVDEPIEFKKSMHILADSKLCSNKKIGGCYKIKFSSSTLDNTTSATINDDIDVISTIPIANNSFIYIGSEEITPPINLKHSLGDLISSGSLPRHLENVEIDRTSCLRTMGYLNTFDLYSLNDNEKGYSIFLPCGVRKTKNKQTSNLWTELGLVLDYLEMNPKIFKNIIQGMFLQGLVYSNFNHEIDLETINGQSIRISNSQRDDTNYLTLNNTKVEIISNTDVLFNQGVIHVLDQVLFPDDFSIPIEDLISTTFDPLYPHHSIDKLINMYPKIKKSLFGKHPYSLLVPTPESLKDFNVTSSLTNLLDFIEFHLIPNQEVHKLISCISGETDNIIKTNLTNGDLICKRKNDKILLQLQKPNNTFQSLSYNKDHEVKLLKHGCTSKYQESMSCVFLIEKPLNLEWFHEKNEDNFLHIHLGLVSVGIGVILGLMFFGGVMVGFIYCTGRKKKMDDELLPRADSGFMSVLTDEDEYIPYDRGYETDVDVLRSEIDPLLLPKKKKRVKDDRFKVLPKATLPRNIGNIKETLSRDRNIPGCSQF